MKNIRSKYLLICILPILVLLYISITPIMNNKIGKEISLRGSLYPNNSGDSSYIEYDIGRIEMDKVPDVFDKYSNDYDMLNKYYDKTIYVILKDDQGFYEVDYATFERPGNDVVYLKGKSSYVEFDDKNKDNEGNAAYLRVTYTLDESINNKHISNDIELSDNYDAPVDVNVKVKLYKGYGLVKEVY